MGKKEETPEQRAARKAKGASRSFVAFLRGGGSAGLERSPRSRRARARCALDETRNRKNRSQ